MSSRSFAEDSALSRVTFLRFGRLLVGLNIQKKNQFQDLTVEAKVLQFLGNVPYHKPSWALLEGQGRLLPAFPSSCILPGSSSRTEALM